MPDYPKETRDPIANVWVSVALQQTSTRVLLLTFTSCDDNFRVRGLLTTVKDNGPYVWMNISRRLSRNGFSRLVSSKRSRFECGAMLTRSVYFRCHVLGKFAAYDSLINLS
jgi:hypothetical protein